MTKPYIKIANIIEEGRYGGPQVRIVSVAEKLKNERIETVVICPEKNSERLYTEAVSKKVKVCRLPMHRLSKSPLTVLKYLFTFPGEVLSLYKIIKKEKVHIMHCNSARQFKGVVAGSLARKKVIWHLNDTTVIFIINLVFKLLALTLCDAFITAGEKVRVYYLSDGSLSERQIIEIQAPVDISVFNPDTAKEDRNIASFSGLKIITVGNINPLKGIEYFIKMASILNKKYNNIVFFVVGSHLTNQRKYSEKAVALVKTYRVKRFHFYGPSDNILSVLKATDIYVCSSIAEASPISVWEAMSMAKPIVSTDVGDVAKFIKNGESGFVVPIKDAEAMAEKTGLLIESVKLRERFGQKAREEAIKHLDLNICVKRHARFYREIIDHP